MNLRKFLGIVILVIVVIIAIILVDLLISNNNENDIEQNINNSTNEDNQEEKKSIKIDESKDYVYDKESNINSSFVVAQFNINNQAAGEANIRLEEYLKKANEKHLNYGKNIEIECSYKKYVNNGILSINQKLVEDVKTNHRFLTYNFNLESGKLLKYDDIYKLLGLTSESVNERVKELIDKSYSYATDDEYELAKKTYQNYLDGIKDNSLGYFLDSNNKLNIVVKYMLPAGSEFDYKILRLK